MKGTYLLYDGQRLFEFEGIYSDEYGLTLKDHKWKTVDLNTIQLNRELFAKIRKLFIEHKLHDEIVQSSLVQNKMFNIMYY
jgi:hypothetical protein